MTRKGKLNWPPCAFCGRVAPWQTLGRFEANAEVHMPECHAHIKCYNQEVDRRAPRVPSQRPGPPTAREDPDKVAQEMADEIARMFLRRGWR